MNPRAWLCWSGRGLIAALLLAGSDRQAAAWTANAADFGYNTTNATAALQAAIDSGADTVRVPNLGSDWIVEPIFLTSNQTVTFDAGVVVRAQVGAFQGVNDCLFTAKNCTDVTVRGSGANWIMRRADYAGPGYTASQWRHTLKLLSCTNVRVENLNLRESGGDGVFIGSDILQPSCRKISIAGVTCEDHYRQGISVTDAVDLTITDCVVRRTAGTAPEAGIDFEPDYANQSLSACRVQNCRFEDNAGAAVLIYPAHLIVSSAPVDITFENCYITSAAAWGIQISPWPDAGVSGTVVFRNCLVEDTLGCGLYVQSKSAYRALARFEYCTWRRVAKSAVNGLPRNPFCLTGEYPSIVSEYGGLVFTECSVEDAESRPLLVTVEASASAGCANLQGTITLITPASATMSLGAKAHDIQLRLLAQSGLAAAGSGAKAFPLPAHDRVNFRLDNLAPVNATVSLYNVAGEKVFETFRLIYANRGLLECDVRNLASGVYIFVVRYPGVYAKGKICLVR